MPIRFARLEDVPQLVEGGRRMHALTRFRKLDFDAVKIERSFVDLITRGHNKYVFLVAEGSNRRVVGALIGVLEKHMFSDSLTANVMHYDVLPEARMGGHGVRLLGAFEQWCRNRKVTEIGFGINSGEDLDRLAQFATRMGYGKVGENFSKELR